jgi:RNA polymerase sigma-B factor
MAANAGANPVEDDGSRAVRSQAARGARAPAPQECCTRKEGALFARMAADGDPRAREALIERFLPLARSLALRYQPSHEPLDDLLQVASLGLIKAIDGFDAQREIAFPAYAIPMIFGELRHYLRDRTWAVRVPDQLQELVLRVEHAAHELADELRRQPTVAEIVAAVGANEEDVLEALQAGGAHRPLSLDEPVGAGADAGESVVTLGESIGVDEHGFTRVEERATFAALLAIVTSREREVLRMRFEQDMAQADIAAVIGISQMHVSRIIRQALARLHHATSPAGCN